MKVSPERILPSQDFLKPETIRFIFECLRSGELDKLPPTPIVREGNEGDLIAVDGHNLIAVKSHTGEDVEVHLARAADDGLPPTSEANSRRNNELQEKFITVLSDRARVSAEGIYTFRDLMARYPDLFEA